MQPSIIHLVLIAFIMSSVQAASATDATEPDRPANLVPDREYIIERDALGQPKDFRIKTQPHLKRHHTENKDALAQLREQFGEDSRFQLVNHDSGYPRIFRPGEPVPTFRPIERATREFLEEISWAFGLDAPGIGFRPVERLYTGPERGHQFFEVTDFEQAVRSKRLTWQQTYKGLEVHRMRLVMRFDDRRRITSISGGWPVRDVDVEPTLTPDEALAIVAADIEPFVFAPWEEPKLVIYPADHGMLAYYIKPQVRIPGWGRVWSWHYYVDAHTGHFLLVTKPAWKPEKHQPRPWPHQMGLLGDPADPCEIHWEWSDHPPDSQFPPGVIVTEIGTPPSPYVVQIDLGGDRDGDDAEAAQAGGTRGAGIKLLPGIFYAITIDYDFSTWDSYNEDNDHQFWDVLFVNVNSEQFTYEQQFPPAFGPGSENNLGSVWCNAAASGDTFLPGSTFWIGGTNPGEWCQLSDAWRPVYIETDLSKDVYLNIGLKTGTVVPTWATVQVTIEPHTYIFNPNPVRTLDDDTLTDNDDARDAVPWEAYQLVELQDLNPPDPQGWYRLEGPWVIIQHVDVPPDVPFEPGPQTPIPQSPDGEFPALRDCPTFEAVMAYHHITQSQKYIQTLGLDPIHQQQQIVDPMGILDDYSFFHAPSHTIFLGLGGVDDGECGDVILHEYGHAVQHDQNPDYFAPAVLEAMAVREGFADYWAASHFVNALGTPEVLFRWIATGETSDTRVVNSDNVYPDDIVPGDEHASGKIWSACLWAILLQFGKQDADRLVLTSHELDDILGTSPGFCRNVLAIRQAASDLKWQAEDIESVTEIFRERKILRDMDIESLPNEIRITVDVADIYGHEGGPTPFTRTWCFGAPVEFTAPAESQGWVFHRWELDGNQIGRVGDPKVLIPIPGGTLKAIYQFDLTPKD